MVVHHHTSRSSVSASFSPSFNKVVAYGDAEKPKQSHEPYAKRPDYSRPVHSLSPEVNTSNLVAMTHNIKNHQVRKYQKPLFAALPVPQEKSHSYKIQVRNKGDLIEVINAGDPLSEAVASFTVQERLGEAFPWALLNNDTGLEVAFYKFKKSCHSPQMELYGKTPLFEHQRYKKRSGDRGIVYPWASISHRHASKMMGLIPISELIEMHTKDETKTGYKIYRKINYLKINELQMPTGMKKKSATLKTHGDSSYRMIVEPHVDPMLMIAFLAATKQLS